MSQVNNSVYSIKELEEKERVPLAIAFDVSAVVVRALDNGSYTSFILNFNCILFSLDWICVVF